MNPRDERARALRRVFLETAKSIVEEQGVSGLSVRKIGEQAGYSYATLYHYFPSRDNLLMHLALDYLDECYLYLQEIRKGMAKRQDSIDRVIALSSAYVRFFLDRPQAFQLAFVEDIDLSGADEEDEGLPRIAGFWQEVLREVPAIQASGEVFPVVYELLGSSLHGKILYHLKRAGAGERKNLKKNVEREVRFLLERI